MSLVVKKPPYPLIITCEHGGAEIPPRYRSLFARHAKTLASHRGFDAGSLSIAKTLARTFGAPCIASRTSRLLIDLNRSETHPRVFSEVTRALPANEKARIVSEHYLPHRERVRRALDIARRRGEPVIHLATHSFTPRLNGKTRRADIGLLYDPARESERAFVDLLVKRLRKADTDLIVRRNYPYLGVSDGLTTTLRRLFPASVYVGVEVEVNQRFAEPQARRRIEGALVAALRETLTRWNTAR